MFNNSNTRIFLQGNEDVARWHLPVVLSKFKAFVRRCKEAGLKQDRFTMFFEDTGTSVFGQYFYGEESVQLYSPLRSAVIREESKDDFSVEVGPKTFFINTAQGYFWVEVRYDEKGLPVVVLTPFVAKKPAENGIGEEFIYPGMGMQSLGMLTGCIGDVPSQRYVLTQSGGVMIGEGEEKGTIKLPGTGGGNARITVDRNDNAGGFFCVLENVDGKVAQVKVISVDLLDDELVVEMKHGVIDMLVEAEAGNITSENFPKTPTYIHRKCVGSYFSPNKTLGYIVDAGSDDEYHGNTFAIPPFAQDKLDNGVGEESYFNHSKDLYGIASLFAAPIEFNKTSVRLVMVSPTLVWSVPSHDALCWGGWGQTQSYAGCIDLLGDFTSNILSPRPCLVNFSLTSRAVMAFDLPSVEVDLDSWCGKFGATAISTIETKCGPKFYYEKTELDDIAEPCSWTEESVGTCDLVLGGGYDTEFPVKQVYRQHWVKNFKENLTVKRKAEFRFGKRSLLSRRENGYVNPYYLFDGLWHLDFGVMYLTAPQIREFCSLCSIPLFAQRPGGLVYFMYSGSDSIDWILSTGHEYVKNLEVVAPLGIHLMPDGSLDGVGEHLGFITRVPEHLNAPHEPVTLTGGVSYPSEDISGKIVNCEYSLISAPCICDEGFAFDTSVNGCQSYLTMSHGRACVIGGCAPYQWTGLNVTLYDYKGNSYGSSEKTDRESFLLKVNDTVCTAEISVTDACNETIVMSAADPGGARHVYGPTYLRVETAAKYTHNLGATAVYSGDMIVVSSDANSAILEMPAGRTEPAVIRWDAMCDWYAEMTVIPGYCDCLATNLHWACTSSFCSWLTVHGGKLGLSGGCGPFTWSISGGSFVSGEENLGSYLFESGIRFLSVVVDSPNCAVSVTVEDTACGVTITKSAENEFVGNIEGPSVLPWGASAKYYHNVPNGEYSGGMTLVEEGPGFFVLKMPYDDTAPKTITITGDCDIEATKTVDPLYCKCESTTMTWGAYSQDISLKNTVHMYFAGGCAPFSWSGSNVSFVYSDGSPIPYEALKNTRNLYVKSTDECSGSVKVYDVCGRNLTKAESIYGTSGTVVGPERMEPGTTDAFYHDLGAGATYTGTLEMVQQSDGGAILRMPAGASGSYTASWTASCGRTASMTVRIYDPCEINYEGNVVSDGTTVYEIAVSTSCPTCGLWCKSCVVAGCIHPSGRRCGSAPIAVCNNRLLVPCPGQCVDNYTNCYRYSESGNYIAYPCEE